MPADGGSTCRQCFRTFSRPEHLARHLLSHTSPRPHQCTRCRTAFKRKDVLVRHLYTCKGKATSSRLHQNRACHRCASKKKKCSQARPTCESCAESGAPCQYPEHVRSQEIDADMGSETALTRSTVASAGRQFLLQRPDTKVQRQLSHHETEPCSLLKIRNFDSFHPDPLLGASLQVFLPSTLSSRRLAFLQHFTLQYNLRVSFGRVECVPHSSQRSWECFHPHNHGVDSFLDDETVPSLHLSTPHGCEGSWTVDSELSLSRDQRVLHRRSCDLHIAVTSLLKQMNDSMSQVCHDLFTPESIDGNLELFWSNWYPNWPVIHRPSFNLETVPTALLAAMVVTGSCYSLDHSHDCFDVVETFAFDELQVLQQSETLYHKVQIMQAAYLTCIFQTWDGGTAARARIRRQRFGLIIAAARDLDMSTVRHPSTNVYLEHFDWIEFVRMEECIRTLLWTFQLDTAYTIFNNMPPHFALRELSMGLASPEKSFQAASAHECFAVLRSWAAHDARPSEPTLYGLIKSFSRPLDDIMVEKLAHESFMNLWCAVASFHAIAFHIDPILGGEQQFSGLQVALDNWQAVWNQRMRNNDEHFFDLVVATAAFGNENQEPWQCPGFWKNAPEYWMLAQAVLRRMAASHESAVAADELSGCMALHISVTSYVHHRVEDADMRSLQLFLATIDPPIEGANPPG